MEGVSKGVVVEFKASADINQLMQDATQARWNCFRIYLMIQMHRGKILNRWCTGDEAGCNNSKNWKQELYDIVEQRIVPLLSKLDGQ